MSAAKPGPAKAFELQRRRLMKAAGVIAVSRAALATKLDIDEEAVIDALAVAGDIIDGVAEALEVQS